MLSQMQLIHNAARLAMADHRALRPHPPRVTTKIWLKTVETLAKMAGLRRPSAAD